MDVALLVFGRAERNLAAVRNRVQHHLQDLSPVFKSGNRVVAVDGIVHAPFGRAETARVVPLSISPHKAGLDDIDDVFIVIKGGLEVRDMILDLVERRLLAVRRRMLVVVGDADNRLLSLLTDIRKHAPDIVLAGGVDVVGIRIVEHIELGKDKRIVVIVLIRQAGGGRRIVSGVIALALVILVLNHLVQAPFRILDIGTGLRIVLIHQLGAGIRGAAAIAAGLERQPVHAAAGSGENAHMGIARCIRAVRALIVVVHVCADMERIPAQKAVHGTVVADFIIVGSVILKDVGGDVAAAPGREIRRTVLPEPAAHGRHLGRRRIPDPAAGVSLGAVGKVDVQHVVVRMRTASHGRGIRSQKHVKVVLIGRHLHGLEGGIGAGGIVGDGDRAPIDTKGREEGRWLRVDLSAGDGQVAHDGIRIEDGARGVGAIIVHGQIARTPDGALRIGDIQAHAAIHDVEIADELLLVVGLGIDRVPGGVVAAVIHAEGAAYLGILGREHHLDLRDGGRDAGNHLLGRTGHGRKDELPAGVLGAVHGNLSRHIGLADVVLFPVDTEEIVPVGIGVVGTGRIEGDAAHGSRGGDVALNSYRGTIALDREIVETSVGGVGGVGTPDRDLLPVSQGELAGSGLGGRFRVDGNRDSPESFRDPIFRRLDVFFHDLRACAEGKQRGKQENGFSHHWLLFSCVN